VCGLSEVENVVFFGGNHLLCANYLRLRMWFSVAEIICCVRCIFIDVEGDTLGNALWFKIGEKPDTPRVIQSSLSKNFHRRPRLFGYQTL
jgi:hypothetical protein